MVNIEYLTNKDGDAIAVVIPIDIWRQLLPTEEASFEELQAENTLLGAQRYGEKIAVEIKCFLGFSLINQFHEAMGQAWNYKVVLEEQQPDRVLHLAVPEDIYEEFFTRRLAQMSVARMQLKLLVFNPLTEEIILWR